MVGNRHTIAPEDNILVGSAAIMKYLKIKSLVTLYQWVERYGLPAVKRPDGRWMCSVTAIDQWLFLAAEDDFRRRKKSRGANVRADIALRQALHRHGPDSQQAKMALDRVKRLKEARDASERSESPDVSRGGGEGAPAEL